MTQGTRVRSLYRSGAPLWNGSEIRTPATRRGRAIASSLGIPWHARRRAPIAHPLPFRRFGRRRRWRCRCDDCRRIRADAARHLVGYSLPREPHIEADRGVALQQTVGIHHLHLGDEIGRHAEHGVVGEVRIARQIERCNQLTMPRRARISRWMWAGAAPAPWPARRRARPSVSSSR
jgi:hypothetical protein